MTADGPVPRDAGAATRIVLRPIANPLSHEPLAAQIEGIAAESGVRRSL